jgi:integrase
MALYVRGVRRQRPNTTVDRRFEPTPDGFLQFRHDTDRPVATATWRKYRPILCRLEQLREERFGGRAWSDLSQSEIGLDLLDALYSECRSRSGGQPSENTRRGRFDACSAYFEFLRITGVIKRNPLDVRGRPSSQPRDRPYLTHAEDKKLAELDKSGTELAVYVLARGLGLREGEICDLEDSDVDLEDGVVLIRSGKTASARREVPLTPAAHVLLSRYRVWRDQHVGVVSTKFVRTRSGGISKAYVWKIVKQLALRAKVRLVLDHRGRTTTEVTPHALRRTFGADLVRRRVATTVFSPILGHASPRVTEESYSRVEQRERARQIIAAAGDGPFSLHHGVTEAERAMIRATELAEADPEAAIAALRHLQTAAAALEQHLTRHSTHAKCAGPAVGRPRLSLAVAAPAQMPRWARSAVLSSSERP